MKNNIADLNNILFEQLERLMDDSGEIDIEQESKKAEVVCKVSDKILEVGKVQLEAMKIVGEYGLSKEELPDLVKNKNIKSIGVAHA